MKRIFKEFGFILLFIGAILGCFAMYEIVDAAGLTGSKYEPFVVNATAYCNPNGNLTASGKPTVEGITIAGKKEWLGCVAALYEIKEDGSIGDFLGFREFTDCGYGESSRIQKGMGTIETGETVDLYFSDRDTCLKWGKRRIFIQVIPGEG